MTATDELATSLYLLGRGSLLCLNHLPQWPVTWALHRYAAREAELADHPAARTLRRRRSRPCRHDLETCLAGVRNAGHPQLLLVWLILLLEGHGATAIDPLLLLIATPLPSPARHRQLACACAWALGQLGRDILPEIERRFGHAPSPTRDYFCQALWYLGSEARGCQRWLKGHDSPWARALLQRLEAYGWEGIIERRAVPVWMDEHSRQRLAQLTFSNRLNDQLYAAQALRGWGPACQQAIDLLHYLTRADDVSVFSAAVSSLQFHGVDANLEHALSSPNSDLREAAAEFYQKQYGPPQQSLSRPEALLLLRTMPIDSYQEQLTSCLPELSDGQQRMALQLLADKGGHNLKHARRLQPFLSHPEPDHRLAAMTAFVRLGGQPAELQGLLSDPHPQVQAAAVQQALAHFDLLLIGLENPAVLEQMRQTGLILHYLGVGKEAQLKLLLERLSDPVILSQLQLDSLQWVHWEEFNPTQLCVARDLALYHHRFPEELLQAMVQGRCLNARSIALLREVTPPETAATWMQAMFRHQPLPQLGHALRLLGRPGWQALLEMVLEGPLAAQYLTLVLRRQEGQEWLREQAPVLLAQDLPPLASTYLCRQLLPLLPPTEQTLAWAVDHCSTPEAEQHLNAAHAGSQRQAAVDAVMHGLTLPQAPLRAHCYRLLQQWKPQGILPTVLTLPAESDPHVYLSRLLLLDQLRETDSPSSG